MSTGTHKDKEAKEAETRWYPWDSSNSRPVSRQEMEDFVHKVLAEQKMEYENKLFSSRNEIFLLRHEILGLKERMLTLSEDYIKLKPIIDERKKNRLLRTKIPFTFVPEKTGDQKQ